MEMFNFSALSSTGFTLASIVRITRSMSLHKSNRPSKVTVSLKEPGVSLLEEVESVASPAEAVLFAGGVGPVQY